MIRPCSLHRDEPLTATAVTLWLAARRSAAPAGHEIPFVCVPAGTRNHFTLDVGVERHDVTGALDAFTDGVGRQIDMAEVNSRMFLNNVSLVPISSSAHLHDASPVELTLRLGVRRARYTADPGIWPLRWGLRPPQRPTAPVRL